MKKMEIEIEITVSWSCDSRIDAAFTFAMVNSDATKSMWGTARIITSGNTFTSTTFDVWNPFCHSCFCNIVGNSRLK